MPSIRRAAKALGMHTEASHRFERGADPEAPPAALARLAHLLAKIGAGTTRPGLIHRYVAPRPPTSPPMVFPPAVERFQIKYINPLIRPVAKFLPGAT